MALHNSSHQPCNSASIQHTHLDCLFTLMNNGSWINQIHRALTYRSNSLSVRVFTNDVALLPPYMHRNNTHTKQQKILLYTHAHNIYLRRLPLLLILLLLLLTLIPSMHQPLHALHNRPHPLTIQQQPPMPHVRMVHHRGRVTGSLKLSTHQLPRH